MNLYSEAAAKDGNDPGISAVNRRILIIRLRAFTCLPRPARRKSPHRPLPHRILPYLPRWM